MATQWSRCRRRSRASRSTLRRRRRSRPRSRSCRCACVCTRVQRVLVRFADMCSTDMRMIQVARLQRLRGTTRPAVLACASAGSTEHRAFAGQGGRGGAPAEDKAAKDGKGKPKKVSAAVAAMQRNIEAQRAADEARTAAAETEKRAADEAKRRRRRRRSGKRRRRSRAPRRRRQSGSSCARRASC